ncbi:biotin--[acetyl-CoA-carboxylase] ligase [Aquabacterium sp.]|uniref:biotin--[acetyl-CoA-carboxylase] ligase n=1 Tax=Aquabacterium sp. TaxID=1872578 RepID=UPI0040377AA5
MPELHAALADLNAFAERIWEAASPACPTLSLEVLPEIGSTNTELMARGRRGELSPTLLAACSQTAGRGRQGRSWLASVGDSLTFSLGLPMRLDEVPGGGSALSLAVGLAVAQALEMGLQKLGTTPITPAIGLKWPNDLWLHGRKLGGILIEASPAPGLDDGQRWVVIGIGLNVRLGQAPEGSAALQSGPFANAGLTPGLVWSWIAPSLLAHVRLFEQQGFAPLQAAYSQRDVLAGQAIGLWAAPGQGAASGHPPSDTGMAQGVSETGALLVHTDKGLQSWTTGEVSVRLQGASH